MNKFTRILLSTAAVATLAGCSSAPAADNTQSTTNETTESANTNTNTNTETNNADQKDQTTTDTAKDNQTATDQSTAANSTTTDNNANAGSNTANNSSTNNANTSTQSMNYADAFTRVSDAFQNAGYSIFDQEMDRDDYEFEARNDNGVIDVQLEVHRNAQAAQREFDDETTVDVDESYTPGNSFTNDYGTLMILYNNFNNMAEVVAMSTADNMTWSIDDIEQYDLDNVLNIMASFGFQTK